MRVRSDAIRRFKPVEIACHWLHVVPFFILIITGLPLYVPELNGVATILGGFPVTRLVHRVAAIVFFFSWMLHPLLDWKGFRQLLEDFVIVPPGEFKNFLSHFALGKPLDPRTGKFNVGQKLLMWATVDTGALMSVTGFIMWFSDPFPRSLVQFMYPLHDLGLIVMGALVIGHIYLAVVAYQGSMSAMTHGYVSRQFARYFHPGWYDKIVAAETGVRKQASGEGKREAGETGQVTGARG